MTEREAQLECDRLAKLTGGKVSVIACNHAGCPWRVIVTGHIDLGQSNAIVYALGGASHLDLRYDDWLSWCPEHRDESKRPELAPSLSAGGPTP